MKVKELQSILMTFNPEAEVVLHYDHSYFARPHVGCAADMASREEIIKDNDAYIARRKENESEEHKHLVQGFLGDPELKNGCVILS